MNKLLLAIAVALFVLSALSFAIYANDFESGKVPSIFDDTPVYGPIEIPSPMPHYVSTIDPHRPSAVPTRVTLN